jgi:hypothetical protein
MENQMEKSTELKLEFRSVIFFRATFSLRKSSSVPLVSTRNSIEELKRAINIHICNGEILDKTEQVEILQVV